MALPVVGVLAVPALKLALLLGGGLVVMEYLKNEEEKATGYLAAIAAMLAGLIALQIVMKLPFTSVVKSEGGTVKGLNTTGIMLAAVILFGTTFGTYFIVRNMLAPKEKKIGLFDLTSTEEALETREKVKRIALLMLLLTLLILMVVWRSKR